MSQQEVLFVTNILAATGREQFLHTTFYLAAAEYKKSHMFDAEPVGSEKQ